MALMTFTGDLVELNATLQRQSTIDLFLPN